MENGLLQVGNCMLTIHAENLGLQFKRGRGELVVSVGREYAPSDLHDLSILLPALTAVSRWCKAAGGRVMRSSSWKETW